MKVGIVGASGYSGEELVRLLARHPNVELTRVTSRTLTGKPVAEELPCLRDTVGPDLCFSESDPATLAADDGADLYFLALPHGVAAEYARALLDGGKYVIDLSADFRLSSTETYKEYYGHEHPAPDLLEMAPYVIPELAQNDAWKQAKLIACPGCYPTSIQLPLIPLIRAGLVTGDGIVINAISGVSGAGKKVAQDFIFCERNESVKAYGLPKHRHLSEIEEQLSAAAGRPLITIFNPHLAPMMRGIATTIVAPLSEGVTLEQLHNCLTQTYAGKPFVHVLEPRACPDTRHVSRTNRVDIGVTLDPRTHTARLTSAEDNLIKGASGQAIQLMNLAHGFEETAGLV